MAYKFLYLDDEEERLVAPFVDAVRSQSTSIDLTVRQPTTFEEDLREIKAGKYDGVILDWRLDKVSNSEGTTAQYKAGAIAQEIRSLGPEGAMLEIPIVLWSTDERLASSYRNDSTSHDLFDKIYLKNEIGRSARKVSVELEALAEGYIRIRDTQTSPGYEVVSLPPEQFAKLNTQVQSILTPGEFSSVHDRARFLLKDLIHTPSLLIDEDYLAARLGIDRRSDGWTQLLDSLPKKTRYSGPFAAAWPRWWVHVVEVEWWSSLQSGMPPLSSLPAEERVSALQDVLQISGLSAAKPYHPEYSTWFSGVCAVTNYPVDPVDGFIIEGRQAYSWQLRRYIVADVALSGKFRDYGIKLEPSERLRLQDLKAALG